MGGINLTGLLDGRDLRHTAKEEEQVTALLWRVTLIYALQDAQVRSRIQFLQTRWLLLRRNGLVYHLSTGNNVGCSLKEIFNKFSNPKNTQNVTFGT